MRILLCAILVLLGSISISVPAFAWNLEPAREAYEKGLFDEAYKLYEPFANESPVPSVEAIHKLAMMHYRGKVSFASRDGAILWLSKLEHGNVAKFHYYLADSYRAAPNGPTQHDIDKFLPLYKKAADAGHAKSQYIFGIMNVDGHYMKVDVEKGLRYIEASANDGYPDASYYMGVTYSNGSYRAKNDELATMWFQKSAEYGNGDSQVQLAMKKFMTKDYTESVKWLFISHEFDKRESTREVLESADKLLDLYDGMIATGMNSEAIAEGLNQAKSWLTAYPN